MTNKLMMAAAGTGVALAMASPAAARTGPVEMAMADYAQTKAGPDAAARERALHEHRKRHAAKGDCSGCGGCGEGDCPHCGDCKDEKIACDDCEDAAKPAQGAKCDPAGHQSSGDAANA